MFGHVPDAEPGAARPPRVRQRRPLVRPARQPGGAAGHAARAPAQRSRGAVQVSAYGCTELGGIIAHERPRARRPSSARRPAARPFPGIEVRIVDPETGEDLPPGEPGEIVGPRLRDVRGLPQRPGADRRGDRRRRLVPHRRHRQRRRGRPASAFHGRTKDMLKVGGENVARARDRVVPLHPPGRAARPGRRHPRRAARRGAGRLRRARARAGARRRRS